MRWMHDMHQGGSFAMNKKSALKVPETETPELTYAQQLAAILPQVGTKYLLCPNKHRLTVQDSSPLLESTTGCSFFARCPTCEWASGF